MSARQCNSCGTQRKDRYAMINAKLNIIICVLGALLSVMIIKTII